MRDRDRRDSRVETGHPATSTTHHEEHGPDAADLDPHSPRRLEQCPVWDRTMLPDNDCLPRFGHC